MTKFEWTYFDFFRITINSVVANLGGIDWKQSYKMPTIFFLLKCYIPLQQHNFRADHSTTTQLYDLPKHIKNHLNNQPIHWFGVCRHWKGIGNQSKFFVILFVAENHCKECF